MKNLRKRQTEHEKGYQYLKLYTLTRLYHVVQICNYVMFPQL